MLVVSFDAYVNLLNFFLVFFSLWNFFLKNNFFFLRQKPSHYDKLQKVNFLKKLNYRFLINYALIINSFFFFSFFIVKGYSSLFWWNHFYINNFNLYVIYYVLLFSMLGIYIIYILSKGPISLSIEYLFSLVNINFILPLMFFANTLYTLIFVLELISCLIFYKFTVSKFWFKKNPRLLIKINLTKFNKLLPKYYVNMLFFQYWSTFFSSVIILFVLINIVLMYGTSEWFFFNFFNEINKSILYFTSYEFFFLLFPLIFGIFLKLGMTPMHLYKIEIYKGIPFLSLFFYTTYYFLIYFIFFSIFFLYYIHSYNHYLFFIFVLVLLSGCLYIVSMMFDGFLIKSFFAFSTFINVINMFIIISVAV